MRTWPSSCVRLPLAILAAQGLLLCSCQSGLFSSKKDQSDVKVSYGSDAEQNYQLGEKELSSKNFPEALKYFEYVSSRFPYSKYAALADLGLADTQFAQERYIEAAERYRTFLKLHPTHPRIDYAAFQVGLSYVNQIPTDFVILPSSAEKDQTEVRNGLQIFQEFVRTYPASSFLPKAQEQIVALRTRLADHEIRVARYYMDHDRPKSAVGRYEAVVQNFPRLGFDAEANLALGRIYIQLKQPDRARSTLEQFLKDNPTAKDANEAKKLLATLPPPPTPAPSPAPAPTGS